MQKYQIQFDTLIGVKATPNEHELALFARAQHYISKLKWIPGIEMVAVANSLSMYATHVDSDIDLFIITQPGMLWFVRLLVTITLWSHGVWRHGEDIAGNFCLSFWITTKAMNLGDIAIDNDIYLYNWIYHLKPIFSRDDVYEQFLEANSWVEIDEKQEEENRRFLYQDIMKPVLCHSAACEGIPFKLILREILAIFRISKGERDLYEMTKKEPNKIYKIFNSLIHFFWLPKTLRKYKKLGSPEGVIISDMMLKFHDQDRRKQIRDTILEKNFDK